MTEDQVRRFFVSHVTTEAPVASVIAQWLQDAGASAFVASRDIPAGAAWLESLRLSLANADVVLVLASRRAIERDWVWFEAGSAWATPGRRCVPVCFEEDFGKHDLPEPLRSLQAIDVATEAGIVDLIALAGSNCTVEHARRLRTDLERVAAAARSLNPWTERTLAPPAGRGVLIDVSHDQGRWPRAHQRPSLLDERSDPATAFGIGAGIELRWVKDTKQLWRHDLSAWRGLLMALPCHRTLRADSIGELVAWVKTGGRLLLLGFELGDRHHESNLNALADAFGLRFNTDIVAPHPEHEGKPYDVPLDVETDGGRPGPLSELPHIRLWNSQSVSAEPGGRPLVALRGLGLSRLVDDSARYDDAGWQTAANQRFTCGPAPTDRHLAAFAPADLCGRGAVLALGTWDLQRRDAPASALVGRLVDWLAGGT